MIKLLILRPQHPMELNLQEKALANAVNYCSNSKFLYPWTITTLSTRILSETLAQASQIFSLKWLLQKSGLFCHTVNLRWSPYQGGLGARSNCIVEKGQVVD